MSSLFLHLDVNKTLVMVDGASGKADVSVMLDSLLSECVWGRLRPGCAAEKGDRTLDDWEILSPTPSTTQPNDYNEAMTFNDFCETMTSLPKSIYKPAKQTFSERFPEVRPYKDALLEAMKQPCDGSSDSDNYYFVVPALFELIIDLQRRGISNYSVVFRTFGNDLSAFAAEWNTFVAGEHQHFKLDPPIPSLTLLLPERSASLYRNDSNTSSDLEVHMAHVCPITKGVTMAHGASSVSDAIMRLCGTQDDNRDGFSRPSSLFIQDHYDHWARHRESDTSGKLLLLDSRYDVRQIFVDDNIERHRAHIVDVRRGSPAEGFVPVPFDECKNSCLLRAEPFDIITNKKYFVEALEARGLL